ncbi:hypothetical protein [Vallitalea okinawensis]|uniref:hypothetical protein n=1 Tax=Vallitalea okinawensis TaxID=2078660 RepID=UPI000CFAAC39|nr:hypothetical protein [Vallitalea okinawensis]
MRNKEYDAFGPWILEINKEHALPPLFVDNFTENNNYLMCIKIPRDIERRNAQPGMNLYDYVIALYEDYLYILKRVDDHVITQTVPYSEIEGIKDYRNLLVGELTLLLRHGSVSFRYNTVSSDIIDHITSIVRKRYVTEERSLDTTCPTNEEYIKGKTEKYYQHLVRLLKKQDELIHFIGLQSPSKLEHRQLYKRLSFKWINSQLQSSVYLSNKKEVIVLQRGKPFKFFREADYSYSLTYIPYKHITLVHRADNDFSSELENIIINTKKHKFNYFFKKDNHYKDDVYRHLRSA